ncbi:MAG: type II secretion system F family protein [Planctomycetota bacterium]|jgi:type IV pilus assembly protein PilC
MAKKLATAYYNLSIMLEAGIPVQQALNTTASGLKGKLRKTFSALAKGVSAGSGLTDTMSKHQNIFATLDVTLVDAAETSGNMPEVMRLLSQWYDLRSRLKGRLISGLMLPLMVLHIAAFVGPLPFLFLGAINTVGYVIQVAKTLALFYIPIVLIMAILHVMPRTSILRRFRDASVLKIPVLGQALRKIAIGRYCWAFYMLYKAGVPITQCAQQATDVTGNVVVSDTLKGGAESARAGNMVCEGFSTELPADFLNIWRVGEETGELDNCVKRLADNTTENAEQLFSEFVQWLPRITYWLICVMLVILIIKAAGIVFTVG